MTDQPTDHQTDMSGRRKVTIRKRKTYKEVDYTSWMCLQKAFSAKPGRSRTLKKKLGRYILYYICTYSLYFKIHNWTHNPATKKNRLVYLLIIFYLGCKDEEEQLATGGRWAITVLKGGTDFAQESVSLATYEMHFFRLTVDDVKDEGSVVNKISRSKHFSGLCTRWKPDPRETEELKNFGKLTRRKNERIE